MVACNNLVDDEGELIFAPGGTAPIYADDTYETELFRIAIVGMAAILFLFLLFFALIQQLMNFLYIFYKEMTLRV